MKMIANNLITHLLYQLPATTPLLLQPEILLKQLINDLVMQLIQYAAYNF